MYLIKTVMAVGLLSTSVVSCTNQNTCRSYELSTQVTIIGIEKIEIFQRAANESLELTDEFKSIPINSLELKVTMEYLRAPKSANTNSFGLLGWIIGSAHACSPIYVGEIISRVSDIDLISTAPFGELYEAGESLSSAVLIERIFVDDISYGSDFDSGNFEFEPLLVEEFAGNDSVFADAAYAIVPDNSNADLVTRDTSAAHQFTVSISLDTGEMCNRKFTDVFTSASRAGILTGVFIFGT